MDDYEAFQLQASRTDSLIKRVERLEELMGNGAIVGRIERLEEAVARIESILRKRDYHEPTCPIVGPWPVMTLAYPEAIPRCDCWLSDGE